MRVAISGSFSTGKSTLFNCIVDEMQKQNPEVHTIAETARELQTKLGVRIQTMSEAERSEFQNRLLQYQIECELKNPQFLSDTSLFDILAYSVDTVHYKELYKLAKDHISENPYTTILFIPIELEIEDDGFRKVDTQFQNGIEQRILGYFHEFNIEYSTISGKY